MKKYTAEEIIQKFNLLPHPEGGYYKETYRAQEKERGYNLGTSIYFLITKDNISKFHRIQQDELWFHHYGADVKIHTLADGKHKMLPLGFNEPNAAPYQIVPKNTIFGSSLGEGKEDFALVSCVVIPGFEFKDFELFSYDELLKDYPNEKEIILQLT